MSVAHRAGKSFLRPTVEARAAQCGSLDVGGMASEPAYVEVGSASPGGAMKTCEGCRLHLKKADETATEV